MAKVQEAIGRQASAGVGVFMEYLNISKKYRQGTFKRGEERRMNIILTRTPTGRKP